MNCVRTPATSFTDSLTTPDPHYIPGYIGYVPQAKYRFGHTYGITSHRVLLDPCIRLSPRSVLTNIHPEYCTDDFGRPGIGADPSMQNKMALVQSRVNSFGRQQYLPNMVPGYTGFVPRFQTILGHTYSPACNRALARFEQDQWRDRLFSKELEALDGWRFCYKSKPWESPEKNRGDTGDLQEFARQPCQANTAATNPRNTVALNQPRSGCCGCSGGPSGSSPFNSRCDYGEKRMWGIATEKNLNKSFGVDVYINPHSFIKPLDRLQTIYRGCEGIIPHYNGHVPGEQFRFGKPFGVSTRNAKNVFEKKLFSPLCSPVGQGIKVPGHPKLLLN